MVEPPPHVRLTRGDVLRAAVGGAAAWALTAAPGLACGGAGDHAETDVRSSGQYFLTAAELGQVRENVDDPAKPWIGAAFQRTVALAREGLQVGPAAPDGSRDYVDREVWLSALYRPGLTQGQYVWCQALAHAVLGDERFAESAKGFMLEWASTYSWPAGERGPRVGHQVAEPVGFMVKAFLAYDLLRSAFSPAERRTFENWAALFVSRGMEQADQARDRPWTPTAAVTNGAAWARCLAMTAAAVKGGVTLRKALDWNWSHSTEGTSGRGEHFAPHGPLEYGWPWLIENAMDASGKMTEEGYRRSIDYALFTWQPLQIIADIDARAGDARLNRFTTDSGKSLLRVMEYYAKYLTLTERQPAPYATPEDSDGQGTQPFSTAVAGYRASAEKFRNAFPDSAVLAEIINTGGPTQRERNFDPYVVGYGAVLGDLAEA